MNKKLYVKWVFFIIIITAIVLAIFSYHSQLTVEKLESWVQSFGVLGPFVFMFVFMIAPVLFLPGSIFSLAGGALFGPILGTIYNLTAATLGATLAFFIARYFASDWVAHKVGGKLKVILDGVNTSGWRFVAFVRLVPLFPFNLLNYALGLTKIDSRQYILASLICMFPGAVAFTYLGYVGREALGGGENLVNKGLLALSFLAALAFIPGLIKRFFPDLNGRLRRSKPNIISVDELYRQFNNHNQIKLIDVRTEGEFNGPLGHVIGAELIPLDQLSNRLDELNEFKNKAMTVM